MLRAQGTMLSWKIISLVQKILKIFIGMTHLFAKLEITKANNSTLLRVTIHCIKRVFERSSKLFQVNFGQKISSYLWVIIKSNKINKFNFKSLLKNV